MTNPTESMSLEFLGGTDWMIDGEPLDYTVYGATNIIVTDSFFVRNNGQLRGTTSATWTAANLTIDNGTITGTATAGGNTTSVNLTYSQIYVATNDTSDNLMKSTSDVYVTSDSTIYGMGLTSVKDSTGGNQFVIFTIEANGSTATVTTPTEAVTISNVTVNRVAVDGYIDLYKFTSVTFDATWGEYTTACNYNIVIVPSEVTVELSQHLDNGEINLINIIPVMAIVTILLLAVGTITFRNRD